MGGNKLPACVWKGIIISWSYENEKTQESSQIKTADVIKLTKQYRNRTISLEGLQQHRTQNKHAMVLTF